MCGRPHHVGSSRRRNAAKAFLVEFYVANELAFFLDLLLCMCDRERLVFT